MGILLGGRGKGGRGALSLSSVSPFKCFLLLLPLLAAGSLLLATSVTASAANKYDTSPRQRKDGVLNVHLVCHTHDDVGWLKTLDQYFYGSHEDIYKAGVQYIIDSVVDHLQKNPNRTYTYVEMAFFSKWWDQASADQRAAAKELVSSGRLTFSNGGWCMHDEAAAHYVGMIDQTTRGHRFLLDTFGYVPKTGWQLDPFGHSATQAYLMGVDLGFEQMVLGRSDHADLAKRKLEMSTEMMWAPSETFGTKKQILTQLRPDAHYSPPDGFCFDYNMCKSDPIMDIKDLEEYNVDQKVEEFVTQAKMYSDVIRGDDILFLMGSDFQWANANVWYKNLDKLIHYVNKDGRVNVFYSTPENYFAQKRASNISFPLKTDDFFPYSDSWHEYWTGYFTSRPSQKHYAFRMQALLQSARQVEYFLGSSLKDSDALDKLDDAVSVLMHHDAITGTAKQAVADDYAKKLYEGSVQATDLLNQGFKEIIKRSRISHQQMGQETQPIVPLEPKLTGEGQQKASQEESESFPPSLNGNGNDNDFVQCRLLNTSVCAFTETSSRSRQNIQIVVYNNLAQVREDHVHLPIGKGNGSVAVFDGAWRSVTSQITQLDDQKEVEDLGFAVTVPPKGFAIYYVMFKNIPQNGTLAQRATLRQVTQNENAVSISSENVVVSFDGVSGYMSHYQNTKNGIGTNTSIEFLVYNSSAGNGQNSGAYIFRPAGTLAILNKNLSLTLVEGPVFSEMRQSFASWLSLSTRLYSSDSWVKLLWKAGSIPISDNFGKEISMRISSGVKSGDEFYTDSNGREMLKRTLNYRPTWDLDVSEPVAGNYYPLTAALAIKDAKSEMSVLLDRACGGTSLNSGDLEFMIHRRILQDDVEGVGEPLNETDCGCTNCNCAGLHIVGSNYLVLDEIEAATQARRNLQQKQQDPLVLAFRAVDGMEHIPPLSGLKDGGLPENVNLMTFHALNSSSVLVRLAHMYQAHESKTLSTEVDVDLSTLFPGKQIVRVSEMSLSANQELSVADYQTRFARTREGAYQVTVSPMEIKTYVVTYKGKWESPKDSKRGILSKLAEPLTKVFW